MQNQILICDLMKCKLDFDVRKCKSDFVTSGNVNQTLTGDLMKVNLIQTLT